jgi:hypothetical protein
VIEEVVSKPSAFGRDLEPDNPDAIATFRLRLKRAHALACFAWQTAIARMRLIARPLKGTRRVHQ